MLHLVLNSASLTKFPLAKIQARISDPCRKLVSGRGGYLPGLPSWRTVITRDDGCAVFDIREAGNRTVAVNAIAWTIPGAHKIWRNLEHHYLGIADLLAIRSHPLYRDLEMPSMPGWMPWLATWILPGGDPMQHCQWGYLADLERKIAAAILNERNVRETA